MTLSLGYLNLEHGGRPDADYHGNGGVPDYRGLVRIMRGSGWPDVFVMGEGDRYELNGGEWALAAALALRNAGGPAYTVQFGSLACEGGMFAPVFFLNLQAVNIRRFWYHRLPDFAARNRNVLHLSLPGRDDAVIRVVAVHGDPHSGDARLAQARQLDRFSQPQIPSLLVGDWNATPSGPHWVPDDLNDPGVAWQPYQIAVRELWRHGRGAAGPGTGVDREHDTRMLDFLVGEYDPASGRRVNGCGFYDIAEMAGVHTPTQHPRDHGNRSAARAIDRFVVNSSAAAAYVPGSYRVHEPVDPGDLDSDHKLITARFDFTTT